MTILKQIFTLFRKFRIKHKDNFKYMVANSTSDIRPRKKNKVVNFQGTKRGVLRYMQNIFFTMQIRKACFRNDKMIKYT